MSSPVVPVVPDAGTRTTTLTRRGWSLTGAAFGLVIGSYLLGTSEMLVVGIAALVLVVAAAGWLRFQAPPTLAVSRRVHPDRLHVGSEGRIDLLVENLGTRATPLLAATDWFDEGRRAARFLVPPLAAGATARAAYRIPTRRRGRYRVGPLAIAVTDPFGVARRSEPSAGEAELVVRPRVHDIVAPVAVGSRISAEHEASAARAVVSDLGDEFVTLRDYELGDDLRRVHWRSTARTGELMIRQDEARWRSRAAVVLDVQPGAHDAASFEVAVEAAASVDRPAGAPPTTGRGGHQRRRGAGHRWRPAPRRDRRARHRRARRARVPAPPCSSSCARTDASTSSSRCSAASRPTRSAPSPRSAASA